MKGLPAKWGSCSCTVMLDCIPLTLTCWENTIAVGLNSGDIAILDGVTGNQKAILSGHTDWVRSIVFSLDGISLVSGSGDRTVKLWDTQTGGVVNTFHGHTKQVLSVSISADSTTIASGSRDMTIHLWDIQTGECHCIIKQKQWIHYVKFSPTDPQYLLSVSGNNIQQWDINGCKISPTHNGSYVTFSSDGTKFASCHEAAVIVQNSDSGATVTKFHIANDGVNYCCFSPDNSLIAVLVIVLSMFGTLPIWSPILLRHLLDIPGTLPLLHFPLPPLSSHHAMTNQSSSGRLPPYSQIQPYLIQSPHPLLWFQLYPLLYKEKMVLSSQVI